jgi:hypothetical protein
VARHARLALALPLTRDRKVLRLSEGEAPMTAAGVDRGRLTIEKARPDEARRLLDAALIDDRDDARMTFGDWSYRRQLARYAHWLDASGDARAAERVRDRRPSDDVGPTDRPATQRTRRPRRG